MHGAVDWKQSYRAVILVPQKIEIFQNSLFGWKVIAETEYSSK